MANIGLMIAAVVCTTTAGGMPPTGTLDHDAWDKLLRQHVREERVDYLTIRSRHWEDLNRYLDTLAIVDTTKLLRDEQLAYYINLYNASTVTAVIERFRADYTPAAGDFALFKEPLVRLSGKRVSLNDLENKIIRPTFGEPRIHVALVCARVVPPLLPRAYAADSLDRDLETNMRQFLNDAARNRVDAKGRTLYLSRIFDWYADDFGGKTGLAPYVNRYVEADTTGFTARFIEYDWSLNIVAPNDGRWVAVRSDGVTLHNHPGKAAVGNAAAGTVLRVLEENSGWLKVDRPFGAGMAWMSAAAAKPITIPDY